MIDIDRLEALAKAATPGPWHWVNPVTDEPRTAGEWRASLRTVAEFPAQSVGALPEFIVEANEICSACGKMDANADYIAAANPAAILELIAEVRRMREERNRWKANHDNQVSRARLLIERVDIPVERVQSYHLMGALFALEDEVRDQRAMYEGTSDEDNLTGKGITHALSVIDEARARRAVTK